MTISAAGRIALGDLDVPRLGFGAMRLPGPGVWGPPADRSAALALLHQVIDLGIRVIDTAWYYGDDVSNELIAAALHPYPSDLVLVTKLGGARDSDGNWVSGSTPDQLRAGNERDLRVLRLDSVPVTHLRWVGERSAVPFEEMFGTMLELVREGRIQRLGLSNVSLEQFELARGQTEIVSVSNAYGVLHRADDPLVDRCAELEIAYLPYFPLSVGAVGTATGLAEVADEIGVTAAQVATAWLLQRSPAMLPIPGTGSAEHLLENVAAADLTLTQDQMDRLGATPEQPVVMGRR